MIKDTELFDELLNRLAQKLRPVIYEVVNDCLSKIKTDAPVQETDDGLWCITDVMKYFGCAKTTVFKWRKQGLIKSHKIGNKVYYKKAEILKALKERSVKKTGVTD